VVVTDTLASYPPALKRVLPGALQRRPQRLSPAPPPTPCPSGPPASHPPLPPVARGGAACARCLDAGVPSLSHAPARSALVNLPIPCRISLVGSPHRPPTGYRSERRSGLTAANRTASGGSAREAVVSGRLPARVGPRRQTATRPAPLAPEEVWRCTTGSTR